MDTILTIFFLILIVGFLVLVHEFGHFITAKLFKVDVQEFAIGFGRKIFSKKYKGTVYSINLLPLGGYVQLEGETKSESPHSFRNQPFHVKAVILLAGVFMNLVVSVIFLTIFLASNDYKVAVPKLTNFEFTNTAVQNAYYPLIVLDVDPAGPSVGQLAKDDVIVSVDGQKFQSVDEFSADLKNSQNKEVDFGFFNFDTFETIYKKVKVGSADESGAILKISYTPYDVQYHQPIFFIKYNNTPAAGFSMTYDFFLYQFKALGSLIKNAVQTGNYTKVSQNVGGLPAVGDEISQVVKYQAYQVLIPLTALFSMNLAMLNVLPFPALDGGQLFFAFIEKVRRKRFKDEFLEKVNFAGFVILMGFGLFVTLKDVVQLNWLEGIINSIRMALGR